MHRLRVRMPGTIEGEVKFCDPHATKSPALGGAWGCRCGVRASRGDRGEIRFRPRATPGPCSPAALSWKRSVQYPGRLPPLPPARAVPRARVGTAAPTSRPCTPQLRGPLVLHGGARLPYRAAAPGGSSVPRRAGHFFSGKLSGSAGQSRGGQEKRSAPGGCDHPGTSPRCEPSPSARVLPLRPPPHTDAQAAAGPSPFALAAPCPPRPAGPQPGLGSPRGGDRGVRTRVRPAAGPGRGSLPRAQSLATCQASGWGPLILLISSPLPNQRTRFEKHKSSKSRQSWILKWSGAH